MGKIMERLISSPEELMMSLSQSSQLIANRSEEDYIDKSCDLGFNEKGQRSLLINPKI